MRLCAFDKLRTSIFQEMYNISWMLFKVRHQTLLKRCKNAEKKAYRGALLDKMEGIHKIFCNL